jgi:hypothetical protein
VKGKDKDKDVRDEVEDNVKGTEMLSRRWYDNFMRRM